jgi:hypothetical protein
MLPIQAIGCRLEDVINNTFPEFSGRVHLYRTLPLDYDSGEVPGITIIQGEDSPNDASSTLTHAAWIATFNIRYVMADTNERLLIERLNSLRLRAHVAIMDTAKVGLEWLLEVAPGPAQDVATDSSTSLVIKELSTVWQALYLADRRNPDVSYP